MVKNNTGRKANVLMDELGYSRTDSGLYCILPFANLEGKGDKRQACFKFGMTSSSLEHRIDSYHTSYPTGVFIFAILSDIKVPPATRNTPRYTKKAWYLKAEDFMFKELVRLGADRILSTARVKALTDERGGVSEFFDANLEQIREAFESTQRKFGGDLQIWSPEDQGSQDFNKANAQKMISARYRGVVPFY
jgi:hypothetical protein